MLARPVRELAKVSKNKAIAPTGTVLDVTSFSADDSRVLHRIGLDLIDVTSSGDALVHGKPEQVDRLVATCETLGSIGMRERARYAMIDAFALIPKEYRIDDEWLAELPDKKSIDAVIELQPLLDRLEVDRVVRAIADTLADKAAGSIRENGRDFSGRHWFRGDILKSGLNAIANSFFSVQSLHSPLYATSSAHGGSPRRTQPITVTTASRTGVQVAELPVVAVVDLGIPADHVKLAPYRRGQYQAPGSFGRTAGSHGSFVASRVVFGDPDFSEAPGPDPTPGCRYYDVNVAETDTLVSEKSVWSAIDAVMATAPDVRVFNLSFDHQSAYAGLRRKDRDELLILVQDLDNQIFANDCLVVVAAGNSPPGQLPKKAYPGHFDEDDWQLGVWARSFNALTCGGCVDRLGFDGLVSKIGWPSPFTRVGPGLANSPKVDFCAHAGNCDNRFRWKPGLGVWGLDDVGRWEDRSGTSYAAPMLAREAALALAELQRFCQQGARPYAAAVKAFLSLTCPFGECV